jgi:hypothetical protein
VDRGVISTAAELFGARHYPGVVAVCTDALEDEPECVPLLLIRARARAALRRDLDAQADLRDVIRLDPQCGAAYRLLGELAARSDENAAAAQFFREALRLDPDDREARDWLLVVERSAPRVRPAAGAAKLPAPAPAAGRFSARDTGDTGSTTQPRFGLGTESPDRVAPARSTRPPEPEDRPTRPFARPQAPARRPVRAEPDPPETFAQGTGRQAEWRAPVSHPAVRLVLPGHEPETTQTLRGRPPTQPPAKGAPRATRSTARTPVPELPGFGEYLVANGVLTRERLRVAQAYQRSMNVQLSIAIVTLGLATPQRIEWAAVAHQSQVAGDRR